jgi:anti-sigma factor RsiW
MSEHRWIEDLVIASADTLSTAQQQAMLQEHLAGCPECGAMAAAYRADQRRLRAIAFQPAPAWIRSAVFDQPTSPGTGRPAWTLAVAALALLAMLLAFAGVAALQRPTVSVMAMGDVDWLTPAAAQRLVGGASIDGGWLVAVADESVTETQLRIYRPETGWTADTEFDAFAAGAGATIQVGPQSSEINTFASPEDGMVLTRDRSRDWSRHDLESIDRILDLAVLGGDVWVLAEPSGTAGQGGRRMRLLSIGADSFTATGPTELQPETQRLAASTDRFVVAGCSNRKLLSCELVITSSTHDGRHWTRGALPREVDLRTPIQGQGIEIAQRQTLFMQLVFAEGLFLTIVPGEVSGTEIWSSPDGLAWEQAGVFDSGPYPIGLVTDGSTVVAVGGGPGDLRLWTSNGAGSWRGTHVDVGVERPIGITVVGDRIFALGAGPTSVDAWQIDIPR